MPEADTSPRALGNSLFTLKDYKGAIREYTTAITGESDTSVLAKLLGNRSACHTQLKNYTLALEDATGATVQDAKWAKGYSRKGDALWGLARFSEAKEAYQEAANLATSDTQKAMYADKIKQVDAAYMNFSNPRPNYQQQYGRANFPPQQPEQGEMSTPEIGAHGAVIALAILYVIPFLGFTSAYYFALKAVIVSLCFSAVRNHGTPKLSKEYGKELILDHRLHPLLPMALLHLGAPSFIILMTPVLRSVATLFSYAMKKDPSTVTRVNEMVTKFGGPSVPSNLTYQTLAMAGQMEVMVAFVLLVQILTPNRNILLLLMYCQYLRVRYMVGEPHTVQAFRVVRMQTDIVFHHQYCPGIIGKAYDAAVAFLVKQGDVQAQAAAHQQASQGGFLSRMTSQCVVM